jgi:hypothetical protein
LEKKDENALHDLILGQTTRGLLSFHMSFHLLRAGTAGVHVLDKGDTQRAATVLVTGELGCERTLVCGYRSYRGGKHTNASFSSVRRIELNNTSAAGAAMGFILDFGPLNLADGGEQIDKILVASGPRQLCAS